MFNHCKNVWIHTLEKLYTIPALRHVELGFIQHPLHDRGSSHSSTCWSEMCSSVQHRWVIVEVGANDHIILRMETRYHMWQHWFWNTTGDIQHLCVWTFPNVMEGLTRETPSAVGMGSPTLPYSERDWVEHMDWGARYSGTWTDWLLMVGMMKAVQSRLAADWSRDTYRRAGGRKRGKLPGTH